MPSNTYYKRLRQGESRTEAMRQVQLNMLLGKFSPARKNRVSAAHPDLDTPPAPAPLTKAIVDSSTFGWKNRSPASTESAWIAVSCLLVTFTVGLLQAGCYVRCCW
jgi:hypothetical protein